MVGAGSLRAEMLQDVGVSEVRVELVRIEKFGNVQRDHTVDSVEPEGSLPAGQTSGAGDWRRLLAECGGLAACETATAS